MKILIVDDNEDSRMILKRTLEHDKHTVESASSGTEALEKAKGVVPDMIISDILMPGMDGFRLCREVKLDEQLRKVPFVLYTATYVDPKDERLGMSLGASRFILKPIETDEFLKIIHEVFREYEGKRLPVPEKPTKEDHELFRMYEDSIVRKLDEKVQELKLYRQLFECSKDAIAIVDPEGFYIEQNPAHEALIGYSNEELIGKTPAVHFGDEAFSDILRELSEKGAFRGELVSRIKSGSKLNIELSSFPISDAKGEILGYVSIKHDITERKRSENFIKNILESLDQGLAVIDPEYRIILANRAYSNLVQIPLGMIAERRCYEVLRNLDRPCCEVDGKCPVKHTFETGEPYSVLRQKQGAEGTIYSEIKSYPMVGTSGELILAIEIINDITGKVKLEEQFRHAQKMEVVGRLSGGIAHDFNNMLSAILGYSELALMELPKGHPVRENLKTIRDAGEKAAVLTRQLLAFSRKQILEIKAVNLNTIVEHMGKMLTRMIGEDLALELNIKSTVRNVMADPGQIEQVLMNLAVNAKDVMPTGGRLIIETADVTLDEDYVRHHKGVKPGSYVMLSVSDTGVGMTKEVQEKIFEPFYTTKEMGKGTGLGLSMVYGLVKQHKGHLFVYSEVGKGTTFKIYLPATEEEVKEVPRKDRRAMPHGEETILVVDDDPPLRNLVVDTLQPLGYKVIGAGSGAEALRICEKYDQDIDLLLTDVIMPGMSGRELVDAFLKMRPGIKIVFMSGYSDEHLSGLDVFRKGTAFIQKPVIPSVLAEKLRETLDR